MDGFLPIYKPAGMTSADVVFKVRKIVHMKRVGHSGTLDPSVDGMLPIALGAATKAISRLQASGKIYTGAVQFGFATTTEDLDGEVVERTPLTEPFSDAEIDAAMAQFKGEIVQIPPMFSAVKVNGRRLYDYARAGETVERPKRLAQIDNFARTGATSFDATTGTQSFPFIAEVGKGTYIRTLSVDLGRKLGVAAAMSQLTRQKSGNFTLEQAVTLEQLAAAVDNNQLAQLVVPVDHAYANLPGVDITDAQWPGVSNGGWVDLPQVQASEVILRRGGILKAVYTRADNGIYKPLTMYLANDGGQNATN
ncbi:tRNA pseudouridine(55) synthase TruB [Lacticaseibacillus sharpeae]|uniref:tRNA pseudouridine(55) synthase TruB n=2 Tax=Lacticaseibacillus sharpeae TaxID=1626 RepID=UPI0006CFCF0C|nr:tRNA pseudouridine(55) synthase TruB [Lacticaseibacillus sharpeae]